MSTFLGGFVVAMIRGWLLTLVMLTSIIPVVIVAGGVAKFMSTMASRRQNANATAATIVEQALSSIKTVRLPEIRTISIF